MEICLLYMKLQNLKEFEKAESFEKAFDALVESIGGCRVRSLFDKEPNFNNADYIFEDFNLVAELKCIDKDPEVNSDLCRKRTRIYNSLVDAGKATPIYGQGVINTEDLDEDAQFNLYGIRKDILERPVNTANKQIRLTKQNVDGHSEALGLLLLANINDIDLDPYVAFYLLNRILKNRYRSIDAVIYLSPNLCMYFPERNVKKHICMCLDIPDRKNSLSEELYKRIYYAWDLMLRDKYGPKYVGFPTWNVSLEELHEVRLSKL